MTKNKRHLFALIFAGFILILLAGTEVLAGEISLGLSRNTDFARIDFGPITTLASTMIWAGDVLSGGNKIGEFTATQTKINYGSNGSVLNYDLTIPTGDAIPEFISLRTNRVISGTVTADKGIIYAASPAFKDFIGLAVYMNGNDLRIVY
jgi:hypothetical protein